MGPDGPRARTRGGGKLPRPVGVGLVPDRVPSRNQPSTCLCPTPAPTRMVDGPHRRGLSPPYSLGTLLRWGCDQRGITGAGFDLSGGNTASLVPVRDDGRGDLAHRHGPVPGFTPTALLPRRPLGCGSLCCNMDVQRQTLTFADRCAVHGLCLLYHAFEAAVMACFACHVLRGCSRGGNRHRLAKQRQL